MILQELIRNYVLYREVLKPLLVSWKDSLTTGYYKEFAYNSSSGLLLALNKAKSLGDGEELGWDISDEYEAKSVTQITGTHTITVQRFLLQHEYDLVDQNEIRLKRNGASNYTHIVLGSTHVQEYVMKSSKTISALSSLALKLIPSGSSQGQFFTTGYESKQINSFLFETHEKREYLGEFSLTHEETPLMCQLEGGEQREIY